MTGLVALWSRQRKRDRMDSDRGNFSHDNDFRKITDGHTGFMMLRGIKMVLEMSYSI